MIMKNRVVSIAKLSKQAFWQYKWQILVLTILSFIGGIFEGIGVNALIPLFSFSLGDGQNGDDFISQGIERFFNFFNISFTVPTLLIFIILLFILRALVKIYLDYIKIKITADYENQTRKNVFSKVLGSDWPNLIKQKLGHIETILMIDVASSAILLREISTVIMLGTSLLVYIIVAINISFNITLITLVLGLVLFLILKPLNYRTKVLSYGATSTNKDIAHHVNENILGVKTVKSMMVAGKAEKKGSKFFDKLRDIKVETFVIKSVTSSLIQPFGVIFVVLIFAFTYKTPDFNFAALVAIIYLIQRIFVYIQQLQKSLNTMYEKVPYLKSALDFERNSEKYEEKNTGTKDFIFNDKLELKNINFAYDQNPVLSDISFVAAKGEMIGIIGPSGVGKTTLVDLLLRLLTPQQGQIFLDDIDIKDIDIVKWRENIGYVSQDMFLINDTIAENIRFYNDDLSDGDVEKFAKLANIYDFIQTLPNKFDTVIGERGVMISAGQRQRLVIARVLARNPKILILDEATSALDNESEQQIQKVIDALKGKVTVIAIAHRLSTIEDSDKLIVLEKGRISEIGSPRELLKDKESYFAKNYNLRY